MQLVKNLEKLDLSQNSISSLEGLVRLHALRELNLASNSIRRIDYIFSIGSLQYIDLSDNRITRIPVKMGKLKRLRTLCLDKNSLHTIEDIQHLSPCSSLTNLSFADNPLAELAHARAYTIFHVPSLASIGGFAVSSNERTGAADQFAAGRAQVLKDALDRKDETVANLREQLYMHQSQIADMQRDLSRKTGTQDSATRRIADLEHQIQVKDALLSEKDSNLAGALAELTEVRNQFEKMRLDSLGASSVTNSNSQSSPASRHRHSESELYGDTDSLDADDDSHRRNALGGGGSLHTLEDALVRFKSSDQRLEELTQQLAQCERDVARLRLRIPEQNAVSEQLMTSIRNVYDVFASAEQEIMQNMQQQSMATIDTNQPASEDPNVSAMNETMTHYNRLKQARKKLSIAVRAMLNPCSDLLGDGVDDTLRNAAKDLLQECSIYVEDSELDNDDMKHDVRLPELDADPLQLVRQLIDEPSIVGSGVTDCRTVSFALDAQVRQDLSTIASENQPNLALLSQLARLTASKTKLQEEVQQLLDERNAAFGAFRAQLEPFRVAPLLREPTSLQQKRQGVQMPMSNSQIPSGDENENDDDGGDDGDSDVLCGGSTFASLVDPDDSMIAALPITPIVPRTRSRSYSRPHPSAQTSAADRIQQLERLLEQSEKHYRAKCQELEAVQSASSGVSSADAASTAGDNKAQDLNQSMLVEAVMQAADASDSNADAQHVRATAEILGEQHQQQAVKFVQLERQLGALEHNLGDLLDTPNLLVGEAKIQVHEVLHQARGLKVIIAREQDMLNTRAMEQSDLVKFLLDSKDKRMDSERKTLARQLLDVRQQLEAAETELSKLRDIGNEFSSLDDARSNATAELEQIRRSIASEQTRGESMKQHLQHTVKAIEGQIEEKKSALDKLRDEYSGLQVQLVRAHLDAQQALAQQQQQQQQEIIQAEAKAKRDEQNRIEAQKSAAEDASLQLQPQSPGSPSVFAAIRSVSGDLHSRQDRLQMRPVSGNAASVSVQARTHDTDIKHANTISLPVGRNLIGSTLDGMLLDLDGAMARLRAFSPAASEHPRQHVPTAQHRTSQPKSSPRIAKSKPKSRSKTSSSSSSKSKKKTRHAQVRRKAHRNNSDTWSERSREENQVLASPRYLLPETNSARVYSSAVHTAVSHDHRKRHPVSPTDVARLAAQLPPGILADMPVLPISSSTYPVTKQHKHQKRSKRSKRAKHRKRIRRSKNNVDDGDGGDDGDDGTHGHRKRTEHVDSLDELLGPSPPSEHVNEQVMNLSHSMHNRVRRQVYGGDGSIQITGGSVSDQTSETAAHGAAGDRAGNGDGAAAGAGADDHDGRPFTPDSVVELADYYSTLAASLPGLNVPSSTATSVAVTAAATEEHI
jgi:Leucine-rich repeat (LRR) protein